MRKVEMNEMMAVDAGKIFFNNETLFTGWSNPFTGIAIGPAYIGFFKTNDEIYFEIGVKGLFYKDIEFDLVDGEFWIGGSTILTFLKGFN